MVTQTEQKEYDERKVKKPEITVPERYDSPFMKLIAPFIATRYLWLAIEDINPFDFLFKKGSLIKDKTIGPNGESGKPWTEPYPAKTFMGAAGRYTSRNFSAFGMGTLFAATIGYYSKNTLHDIKSLYSEAVGYELGKKPEDVTTSDLMNSQNAALEVTRNAYIKRSLMRIGAAATFFIPWHHFRKYKEIQPKYETNMNVGVGTVGTYLLGESFLRTKSFFDAEQELVNSAIHHRNANPNQSITSMNIKGLLLLQRQHLNKNYQWPEATSQEGQQQLAIAERIASLMNQTYENDPKREPAHFTIGKFNFLLGFGLLDAFPESMGFVELANKSADMSEVKQAVTLIRSGKDARTVFAQFGIDVNNAPSSLAINTAPDMASANKKFTSQIQPKSLAEFATHSTNPQLSAIQ